MKYHTRHEYIEKTGKRISKGAWERLNRAYDVHLSKVTHFNGQERLHVTFVLKPETTKANRKVRLMDRFGERSKRERYKGEPIGSVK